VKIAVRAWLAKQREQVELAQLEWRQAQVRQQARRLGF